MSKRLHVMKLNLDRQKAVEAIDYVARQWPGVTQYYLCKVMYFADKEHCLDWGRTITGDRYVAMDHGPVPSRVYEMLKPASGEEDELLNLLSERVLFQLEGNKIHVHSKGTNDFSSLSATDLECLSNAITFCKPLGFSRLREITHRELAWSRAAKDNSTSNPPMDLADWFEGGDLDREKAAAELIQNARHGVR
ncbi:Panacea domain-containing protein [Hyphomicrobium sp. MC1]|uniref:Panacea domain-containing protein n=1 Tax=Hyphomicrobium sp. (strain MC1) TaxID=717785 RepID=UPI000213E958|nr:Panacea domain-containing protein [Hyphomicrobium sp. MC1]CCB67791.1 protein of unknown function [Hyphomicrobium sp. MC1]